MSIKPIKLLSISLLGGNLGELFTSELNPSSDFAFIRGGVGFYTKIFQGGAAVDYFFNEEKVVLNIAAELFLLKRKLRISTGIDMDAMNMEFEPNIGIGLKLWSVSLDYNFAYPTTGVFDYGSHIISVGFEF